MPAPDGQSVADGFKFRTAVPTPAKAKPAKKPAEPESEPVTAEAAAVAAVAVAEDAIPPTNFLGAGPTDADADGEQEEEEADAAGSKKHRAKKKAKKQKKERKEKSKSKKDKAEKRPLSEKESRKRERDRKRRRRLSRPSAVDAEIAAVPAYPTTPYDIHKSKRLSLAREVQDANEDEVIEAPVALRKFFCDVIEGETKAIRKTFGKAKSSKSHAYVTAAVEAVSKRFLQWMMSTDEWMQGGDEEEKDPQTPAKQPALQPNPQNVEARRQVAAWLDMEQQMLSEIEQWQTIRALWEEQRAARQQKRAAAAAADSAKGQKKKKKEDEEAAAVKKLLSKADLEFLSQNSGEVIARGMPGVLQTLAIQGDGLLNMLKSISKAVDDAHRFQRDIADRVNRNTIDTQNTDPRNLIALLSTGNFAL